MRRLTYPAHQGHAALRKGRTQMSGHAYHVTICTKSREPIFNEFEKACVASRAFHNPNLIGDATLLTWVLMPDHAHLLLRLGDQDCLSIVVARLKSASARGVNQASGRQGAVWGKSFHDHAIRGEEYLLATARYLVENPLRAGLARNVGEYPFWNSVWI